MGSHGNSVLESGRATAVQPSGAAALLFSRQEAHAILRPRSGRIRARCELVGRSQLWPEELTFNRKTGRVAVGTRISPRPPQLGRIEARTGLRMMPTSPRSPLSSVRRVFPSTAGRLAFPAVPSQRVAQFKPAPGIRGPRVGLLPSFVHLTVFPNVPHSVGSVIVLERQVIGANRRPARRFAPAGFACPVPRSPLYCCNRYCEGESDVASGTVKWFNGQKGYGFIAPDGGGKDVFVHISAVEKAGLDGLPDGAKVTFDSPESRQGIGGKSAGEVSPPAAFWRRAAFGSVQPAERLLFGPRRREV